MKPLVTTLRRISWLLIDAMALFMGVALLLALAPWVEWAPRAARFALIPLGICLGRATDLALAEWRIVARLERTFDRIGDDQ